MTDDANKRRYTFRAGYESLKGAENHQNLPNARRDDATVTGYAKLSQHRKWRVLVACVPFQSFVTNAQAIHPVCGLHHHSYEVKG